MRGISSVAEARFDTTSIRERLQSNQVLACHVKMRKCLISEEFDFPFGNRYCKNTKLP